MPLLLEDKNGNTKHIASLWNLDLQFRQTAI